MIKSVYSLHGRDRPLSIAVAANARAAASEPEGVIFARITTQALLLFPAPNCLRGRRILFLSIVVVANARARDRHIRPRSQALAIAALNYLSPSRRTPVIVFTRALATYFALSLYCCRERPCPRASAYFSAR
jgi:hypothetical protein